MEVSICEELYARQRPKLVSRAWMILGSREVAEDVVQGCFVQLLGYDLAEIENPSAYLQTMVAHGCFREIKRRNRMRPVAEIPESVSNDPEHSETASLLRELSARRRMALVLRYCDGYSVSEIAHIMQCSPSTVSSLLHRAINQLRRSPRVRAIVFD